MEDAYKLSNYKYVESVEEYFHRADTWGLRSNDPTLLCMGNSVENIDYDGKKMRTLRMQHILDTHTRTGRKFNMQRICRMNNINYGAMVDYVRRKLKGSEYKLFSTKVDYIFIIKRIVKESV